MATERLLKEMCMSLSSEIPPHEEPHRKDIKETMPNGPGPSRPQGLSLTVRSGRTHARELESLTQSAIFRWRVRWAAAPAPGHAGPGGLRRTATVGTGSVRVSHWQRPSRSLAAARGRHSHGSRPGPAPHLYHGLLESVANHGGHLEDHATDLKQLESTTANRLVSGH
jgi:hypothetical protein